MTVTVTDDEDPTVTAAIDVVTTTSADGAGNCDVAVAITDATFGDNCTGSTLAWAMTGAVTASGTGQVGTYTFPIGVTTITYTVSDLATPPNTATDFMTVTVTDDEDPTVTAAIDVVTTTSADGAGNCDVAVAITDATFGDNCTGSTLAWAMTGAVTASGTGQVGTYTFPIGVTTITYTVSDLATPPNTATDFMTVTVTDDEDPTVTAAIDVVTTTSADGAGNCDVAVAITDATFGDNCTGSTLAWAMTGAVTASGTGQVGTYTFPIGVTTITYTVSDLATPPNTATDFMTVTVTDDEDPTVTAAIDVVTTTSADGAGNCDVAVAITDATFGDNCTGSTLAWAMTGAVTASGTGQVGTYTFPIGVTTITYTVSDLATPPNTATDFMTVTVTDDEDPTITTCPSAQDVNLNGNCEVIVPDLVAQTVATDNCGVTVTQSPAIGTALSSSHNQTHTVTITATDAANNAVTCTVTLTGKDVTPPTLTVGPTINTTTSYDGTGNCTAAYPVPDVTFGDNCSGSSLAWVMTGQTTGSGNGQVGTYTFNKGATVITYTVTDAAFLTTQNTVTVNVADDEPPLILLSGSPVINLCLGTPYSDAGATAADNCDAINQANIVVNNPVNINVAGTYIITYDISDASSNPAIQVTRTVIVAPCALTGSLTYYNSGGTPMNNVVVDLLQGGTVKYSAANPTDASGNFTINNVVAGTYDVRFTTVKPTGGINSTDAAQTNYFGTNPYAIEKVRYLAGEVSGDKAITSFDASNILTWFVNNNYNNTGWAFWQTNDQISATGWTYPTYPGVTVTNSSQHVNFYALAKGDFNRSFVPGSAKSASPWLTLSEGDPVYVGSNTAIELPFTAATGMSVGPSPSSSTTRPIR
jgi:large repetitive protein